MKLDYSWLSDWSRSSYSEWILAAVSTAESSVFPIPVDPLLVAMCAGHRERALRFAALCSVSSVVGGIIGYAIGLFAFDAVGDALLNFYDPQNQVFERVEEIYDSWGFWGVLASAITPIPYKIFTIASGVFHFNFALFVLASLVGRNIRYFAVAGLIHWGGDWLRQQLDDRFQLVATSLVVVLIGCFLFLKFL